MIKYAGTTKEQVIQKLRETREKLWAEKMAAPVQFEMKAKGRKMTKRDAKEALKHFEKLREMIAQNPSPIFKMKKEDVIKEMRKTREELWNKKYAAHSR